jgi:hypothetical protein
VGIPSALTTIWADWSGPDTFIQIISHNERLKVFPDDKFMQKRKEKASRNI